VLCENSAHGLRGCAVVELEHAAEPLTAPNRACSDQRRLGRDSLVAQPLVWSFLVIQVDNPTPIVPSLKTFVIRGIHGSVSKTTDDRQHDERTMVEL
jgi:hypothetical protein